MTHAPESSPASADVQTFDQTHPRAMLILMSVCAAFVFGLGASLNLAIDRISTSVLHPSPSQVLWIVDTYLVVFGCLLIPSGSLGDRFGRKSVLLCGLAMLAAGSAVSAVASNVPLLLSGRAIAGAGAALILPNSLALLVQVYTEQDRPHAIAVWTGMSGLGGGLGNMLGGVVLEFFDWQTIFTIATPIAMAAFVLVWLIAPRQPGHRKPLDLAGAALLMLGIFSFLNGFIEGHRVGWCSAHVLGMFTAAAVLGVAFFLTESRQAHPLISPGIFRSRGLTSGMLGITLSFIAMYSLFYLNGQYLMSAKGFSPLIAGLCILPLVVMLFWLSPRSIHVAKRFGASRTVGAGLLILTLGLVMLSLCNPDTPYLFYGLTISVIGTGSALSNPLLSTAIVSSLPPHQAGVASGLNSFTREIGGALGVALVGSLLGARFPSLLPASVKSMGDTARNSVSSALANLHAVGRSDPTLVHAVRQAFTDAMASSLHVVIVISVIATVLVMAWYPVNKSNAQ